MVFGINNMKNKKNFNNIRDSICLSLFFVLYVCFTLIFIWFGVLNPSEGTNPTVGLIISITIFVPILVAIAWLIVSKCYEYWILTDDFISSKKMFKKETVIYLADIPLGRKPQKTFRPHISIHQ